MKGLPFVNHKSVFWSHEPKIQKTSICRKWFFPKYDNYKIISAVDICLELNEWHCLIKEKKPVGFFGLFQTTSLCINRKNYKNIARTDFVNVDIVNFHSYKENYSFILEFIKRCIYFVTLWIIKSLTLIYDHIVIVLKLREGYYNRFFSI